MRYMLDFCRTATQRLVSVSRQLSYGTADIQRIADIADVSNFVHPDTPMDNEAASRGTTVYLVDNRIDMLPALLGTNLCSLRPYVERLAFSAIWVSLVLMLSSFSLPTHIRSSWTGTDTRRGNCKCPLHQVRHRLQSSVHL